MAINPVASADAFAEETTGKNYDVATAADANVTISFTPTTGSASLTPTTSDGASAKIDVTANVKIASTGGYSIYLGGENAALTGAKTGTTIPGATTTTTFNNMKTNTWGYAYAEGTTVPDAATYSALPQGQGKILESVSGNNTNIDKTYAISFATKIGNDKPADVYSNQVTLSVTSSPLQITTLADINDMQSMTSKICEKSAVGDTKQLKDTRDGKYYWVTKLKDNKCWMTQNLDLDLSKSKKLTVADSDVPAAGYTPQYNTESQATDSTLLSDATGQRSWNLGSYRITNPTVSNDCGSYKNDLSQCSSQFATYNTPTNANRDENAHYIVGNFYQWNTATAGTGDTITSGQAPNSVCPKGWRLPTGGSSGEFKALVDAYSIGSDVAKLTSSPLYFVRGGGIYQETDGKRFTNAGRSGDYWSSTPSSESSSAYTLWFIDYDQYVYPVNTWARNRGYSVRCVAR